MLPPRDSNPVWKFVHLLITLFRFYICRLSITGREHVPKEGGAVIACNHPGGIDVFVLGYSSPRQIYYMAKQELFEVGWWLDLLLAAAGAFPVRRGQQDLEAITHSIELVKEGKILGMFPEGTRNRGRGLRRARNGAVRIALRTNTPVIPAAVTGIVELNKSWWHPLRRPVVTMQFGEPIHLPSGPADNETLQAYSDRVMLAIGDMLPQDQRGIYDRASFEQAGFEQAGEKQIREEQSDSPSEKIEPGPEPSTSGDKSA